MDESGAKETGETAGATKYEDGGTIFAVDGAMVVLAGSEEALDQALERADGDGGLSQDDYEEALEGLPGNSLASVYADLEELIGTSADAKEARKVKWVDALRTLGLTATASDGGVELQFNVRTDPEGLTDEDLPMAAGDESPPVLSRPGEIGLGLREPSQVIEFAEAAFQSVDPSGFGDYEQAKQTLDSRLGISIDDDLIAQLGGDMSASLSLDGEFGVRAEPKNAAEFEKTLAKIADVLPAFAEGAGLGDLQVEKPSGGNPFYTLGGPDGDVAAFGVTDGVFVVASDTERAGEIALQDPESVDGAEGALALRSDARALVNAVIRQLGPQLGLGGAEGSGRPAVHGPARGPHGFDVGRDRRPARPDEARRRLRDGCDDGPLLQQRQRVDRVAAGVPAAHPDLEVQVRARRAPGGPHLGHRLARRDPLAGLDGDRAAAQVHEHVVAILAVPVDHHVPARSVALVAHELDAACVRRHDGRPLGRRDVLTLMAVAGAAGAEARVRAAEVVGARDGEDVAGLAGRRRRSGLPMGAPLACRAPARRASAGGALACAGAWPSGVSSWPGSGIAHPPRPRHPNPQSCRSCPAAGACAPPLSACAKGGTTAAASTAMPSRRRVRRSRTARIASGCFRRPLDPGRISCSVQAILQRRSCSQEAAMRERSSIAPRLLSGSLRFPHLGDCTHDGQPAWQRHSEISRSASPTRPSKRS